MGKVFGVALCLLAVNVYAEEVSSDFSFNGKLGVSPYTGLLGVEIQKGKWSLGLGVPGNLSIKRYMHANEDSVFYGVYWSQYKDNSYDDYEQGAYFDSYERKSYGVGAGYIWLWVSGWNVSTGLSVGEFEKQYSNSNFTLTEDGIRIDLELSVGYKF